MTQTMTAPAQSAFSAPLSRLAAAFALTIALLAGWTVSAKAEDLAGGGWTVQNYDIAGTWRVYTEDGATYIELSDDFRTRRAPDLKLFFSPRAAGDITDGNATDGSLLIAELEKNRNGQRYRIPEGTDLDDYESLVLHCERFSKLWGATPL